MQKQYDPEFKEKVIKEAIETGNQSLVGRKYDLNKSLVSHWVRSYKGNGRSGNGISKKEEMKKILQENQRLKNLLGEKDLEIAILQDLVKKTNRRIVKD
jgi:transposase